MCLVGANRAIWWWMLGGVETNRFTWLFGGAFVSDEEEDADSEEDCDDGSGDYGDEGTRAECDFASSIFR